MVSKHLLGATRTYGDALRQIATTFGSRQFTNADLQAHGLSQNGRMGELHRSGCVERVGRTPKGKSVWRLSSELVDLYAAEATV